MKKKILIVFLICCMLFGVASPAMAADFYPEPPSSSKTYRLYFIIPSGSNIDDSLTYPYLCIQVSSDDPIPDKSFYLNLNDNGDVDTIYFPIPDPVSAFKINIYEWNSSDSAWYSYKSVSVTNNFDTNPDIIDGYFKYSLTDRFPNNVLSFDSYTSNFNSPLKIYGTDENFPPAPPLVNLTEELIQMTPGALDLDGKMMILAPFGISCLALLISLPLLSNLLRRFLN